MKGVINSRADLIDDLFFTGQFQGVGIDIICDQPGRWDTAFDSFGDRTADQSQPNKTTGQIAHLRDYLSYSFRINPFLL